MTAVYSRDMKHSHQGPNSGMVVVFVVLLSLANPLLAKCPTYSAKINGNVKCSFKPDDKVLATLIFFEHQPEASGAETAMDIRDGTFDGRVAFDTYSSSGLLSGDKCHRRPKSVLIRLIEANGVEKDRKSLNIASDFNYDEGQGEYTPKSDVILHGWCQAQCDGGSFPPRADWRKVDAGAFSLFAPTGWEFHQLQGVDSYVGEFVDDGVVLKFDFGGYSNSLKEERKPAYVVAHKSILVALPDNCFYGKFHLSAGIAFRTERNASVDRGTTLRL
jgi:hypothetical protein